MWQHHNVTATQQMQRMRKRSHMPWARTRSAEVKMAVGQGPLLLPLLMLPQPGSACRIMRIACVVGEVGERSCMQRRKPQGL